MTLAFGLRYGIHWDSQWNATILQLVVPLISSISLWTFVFYRMQLDGFRRGWKLSAALSELVVAVSFLVIVFLAGGYLFQIFISRLLFTYFGVLLFVGFAAIRFGAHSILGSQHLAKTVRRVLIVGSGPVAREMATKIDRHPEMLCQVVGFLYSADSSLDSRVPAIADEAMSVQTLGVIELIKANRIDEIIITLSKPGGWPEIANLATRCRREGVGVSVVPHPYELYLSRPQLLDIGGLPVLQLRDADEGVGGRIWKRCLDVVLGGALLILLAPVLITGALILAAKNGGSFCRELRCGKLGEKFFMYRLNSDRDAASLPLVELVMQQLSITELPQLWNVLRGEMSLVGPRPESPERVKHYSDWQRRRLNLRPGMTGLAQVHGLRQQHSSEEKARFDLQYMLQCSFFLDVSLLLQTAWTLTGRIVRFDKWPNSSGDELPVVAIEPLAERSLTRAHSAQSSAD